MQFAWRFFFQLVNSKYSFITKLEFNHLVMKYDL